MVVVCAVVNDQGGMIGRVRGQGEARKGESVGSLPSLTTIHREAGLACDEAVSMLATGVAGGG